MGQSSLLSQGIVEVAPNLVSIIEIVPDGRDGWVERPRSLSLSE